MPLRLIPAISSERGRTHALTAEEYCRFAMRISDHLKAARLNQQKAEDQARGVEVFLCGTAVQSYWESDVKKVLGSNSSAATDTRN